MDRKGRHEMRDVGSRCLAFCAILGDDSRSFADNQGGNVRIDCPHGSMFADKSLQNQALVIWELA